MHGVWGSVSTRGWREDAYLRIWVGERAVVRSGKDAGAEQSSSVEMKSMHKVNDSRVLRKWRTNTGR